MNYIKRFAIVIALLSLGTLLQCLAKDGTWHLTARQKCYDDNFCYSADSDCALGAVILRSGAGLDQNSNPDPLTNLLLSPAVCVGAMQSCINECKEKHPF